MVSSLVESIKVTSHPLKITEDLRQAIRKTHPIEGALLELLLEKGEAVVIDK